MLRTCSKNKCPIKCQSIWEFRPGRGEVTIKKQYVFKEAFDNNDEETMDNIRCKMCWHCRELLRKSRNSKTSLEGQCKYFFQTLKQKSQCYLCDSTENIEFDHIDPSKKKHNLSDYTWWKWNGGVEAMKEEFNKCRALCRPCHDQQKTTHKRKYEDIEYIPRGTKLHTTLFLQAKYRKQKREYNIEKKINHNQCKDCGSKVDKTNAVSFHWAHIDPTTKSFTISDVIRDNICFETSKKKIDQEIEKCELKCAACHKKETDKRRNILVY